MPNNILIYGAYGYTGKLAVIHALQSGLRPLLAGRDESKLQKLSEEHDLDSITLDVEDFESLCCALDNCSVVLNCAGPFINTWRPMVEACLKTQTHYLDITGEIEVFSGCAEHDNAAKAAGICLMPGVGFDVVPTDCMALMLREHLPKANEMILAISGLTQASRGTATTAFAYLADPPVVRKNGELRFGKGPKIRKFDFGSGPEETISSTWGDVVTAWHTTGISSIEIFLQLPPDMMKLMKLPTILKRTLASPFCRPLVNFYLRKMPDGPDENRRANGKCTIYGRAEDPDGNVVEMLLRTCEGYEMTGITAISIAKIAAAGELAPGFQTPAGALGAEFILGINGCEMLGQPSLSSATSQRVM